MALRGAPWVLTLSTMLPHQAKKRVEAGGASAATGARPRAPWAPPRDARAAWQMWWTHWNNARWRSWSKTSQKVSDERKRLLQPDVWSAGPHHLPGSAPDFYYTLLSFPSSSSSSFFLSVLFSFSLSLFPSVLNPHTFRWEASLCFFFQHTDRQHWLLGPIVHRALHIYHNLTNKMQVWMHVLVCVVCTGVRVKGLQTYFSRLTNHQMFPCFNLKQLLKNSLSSVIILSPFLVIL